MISSHVKVNVCEETMVARHVNITPSIVTHSSSRKSLLFSYDFFGQLSGGNGPRIIAIYLMVWP